jgi:hypothetical protein
MTARERPLGMRPPTDKRHVSLYGLRLGAAPTKPTPVVMGVNWYTNFDRPVEKTERGRTVHYIGLGDLGRLRGGHAICCRSPHLSDLASWWTFYDQGMEGACVGFAVSRMMTQLNRVRYDAFWVYHQAQEIDEWPGTRYSGTSTRAGCDVARDMGMRVVRAGKSKQPNLKHGIEENRWGQTIEEIAACLSPDDNGLIILNRGWLGLNNSWGNQDYEHEVRMPLETADRLLRENGEFTVVIDR